MACFLSANSLCLSWLGDSQALLLRGVPGLSCRPTPERRKEDDDDDDDDEAGSTTKNGDATNGDSSHRDSSIGDLDTDQDRVGADDQGVVEWLQE